jgi:hypothetical protein
MRDSIPVEGLGQVTGLDGCVVKYRQQSLQILKGRIEDRLDKLFSFCLLQFEGRHSGSHSPDARLLLIF